MDDHAAPNCLTEWFQALRPLRALHVRVHRGSGGGLPLPWEGLSHEKDSDWSSCLPAGVRPGVFESAVDELDRLDPDASFDLGFCPDGFEGLPAGACDAVVQELRSRCRFLAVGVSRAGGARRLRVAARRSGLGLSGSAVLDRGRAGDRDFLLIRGGSESRVGPREGRIVYLSPNREIRGGVKVLYNHVDVLNSIGIPAALAVREVKNVPASWWAWNPRTLAFMDRAAVRTTPNDVVVIPEFRFREAAKYQHVAGRLLFVQNPGLCFEVETWRGRGYEGVLTLGCPDGTKSKLHEFLLERTDLPIFPITNHYSDDPWGKAVAKRVPGRVLCLPRKGPEFVARLRREFAGAVAVDDAPQPQMAVEYAKSDVYVHTGFPEGQPMPPIEAMASGCIVCGFTGLGGLDVMRDGCTAFVAPDGDYEALAAVVRRALSDPAREAIRESGRRLAAQFRRSVAAEELRRCYREWVPTLGMRPRSRLGRAANRVRAAVFGVV